MQIHHTSAQRTRWLAGTFAALLLGGCASFSPDGGMGAVQQAAKRHLNAEVTWQRTESDRQEARQRVAEILNKPLSANDAVQVALLNNRGLQGTLAQLGISESDLVTAGRLPNPGFSFGRLRRGEEVELNRTFNFNLARLILFPLVQQVEQRRFEQTRRQVALNVLSLASETRKAYFQAVAAEQTRAYSNQVQQAAEAGAELAKRMAQVGNWGKLHQAREHSFYADAALNTARAEQASLAAREALTRLLGIDPKEQPYELPHRLPDLPKAPDDLPDIEQTAMDQRLDVQAAKLDADQLAHNLGLTRATRFINVLELGVVYDTSNQEPTQRGYEISVEIPLFDWGSARTAKAEALYMQAVNQAAQTALDARSQVREAYRAYRSTFEIARHYRDEIVPLKKRISDEMQLQYNGMFIGVFELLADARSQIESVNGYIQAQRDFWIARADLDMALTGKPSTTPASFTPPSSPTSTAGSH